MLDGTSNARESRIHVFCDAFEKAHGAALYIRSTSREGIIVRLVCSKNRLHSTEESNTTPSGAASCAGKCKVTAVLLPRDRKGTQECHAMD